ncbi:MAG: YifB family Mg chelatase-like AAA ATPase [Arenicellales bacterium]|nr:YifB family Mg chelatase-like AAA ATPase [Arenicellales bacterium]
MSLAVVYSRAQIGIAAPLVTVEVHLSNGLPRFTIVGLPETAVRESKDRVRSALINSGFRFPSRKITVNLGPADLPKEGGRYDLPIAIGILAASGQLKCAELDRYEFIGELSLNGELRGVRAALPAIIAAKTNERATLIAKANGQEATLIRRARVYAAGHLLEVTGHLIGDNRLAAVKSNLPKSSHSTVELADIRGQKRAKRALEIAAAGGHNLLMLGPPGAGKTMLASRLPGILPNLNEHEALEVAALKSLVEASFDSGNWSIPPFRSPHHSSSSVALVGGGSQPKPGEISLAHNGILFLDELPEFARNVLDQLREPLESGVIHISRASRQVTYPARFQLVAAMNPCKCGWLGDNRCRCTEEQIQKYRSRVSGPLLDRIDLHIEVPPVSKEYLYHSSRWEEPSSTVRERVIKARERQHNRLGCLNQQLHGKQLEQVCCIGEEARRLLDNAMDKLGLSARAYHRILRVARTIADLAGDNDIQVEHVSEAIGCRALDRTHY